MNNKIVSENTSSRSVFVFYPRISDSKGVVKTNHQIPLRFLNGGIELDINETTGALNVIHQYKHYFNAFDIHKASDLANQRFFIHEHNSLREITLDDVKTIVKQHIEEHKMNHDLDHATRHRRTIHLRAMGPTYLKIQDALKGEKVKAIMLSDIHGSPKALTALSIFPDADVINLGDIYDRADKKPAIKGQFLKRDRNNANNVSSLFQTYDTYSSQGLQQVNRHFKGILGNHDAMILGAALGQSTSVSHALRFILRYEDQAFLTDKLGLDLSKALELAKSRNYLGNYKAKDDNKLLEALFTDIQLKLTYGRDSVTLNNDELAFLENIKMSGNPRTIFDKDLNNLEQKIHAWQKMEKSVKELKKALENKESPVVMDRHHMELYLGENMPLFERILSKLKVKFDAQGQLSLGNEAGNELRGLIGLIGTRNQWAFTPEEVSTLQRIKHGNKGLAPFEKLVIEDLQTQIIKSQGFRNIAKFLLGQNKLFQHVKAGSKHFLMLHSHIPLQKDGSYRDVMVDGKHYKGIKLLKALEAKIKRYKEALKKLDNTDENAIKEYLASVNKEAFFDWLAWDPESPVYGREMQTFERAYLPEADIETSEPGKNSTIYSEPADAWYDIVQGKKQDAKITNKVLSQIADELGIETDNLYIVNGHTPSKVGELETFGNGKFLRIDGGASSAYDDFGIVTLLTEKGNIFSISLADPRRNEKARKANLNRYKISKLVNGAMVPLE